MNKTFYKTLLENQVIRDANIVFFIDSRLFENRGEGGLSGEEFKLIIKKIFPYIVVISQKLLEKIFKQLQKKKKYDFNKLCE